MSILPHHHLITAPTVTTWRLYKHHTLTKIHVSLTTIWRINMMIFAPLQVKYFGKRHQLKVLNQAVNHKNNNQTNKVNKWFLNHKEATLNSPKSNNNHKKTHKNINTHKNQNHPHKEYKDKDNSQKESINKEDY